MNDKQTIFLGLCIVWAGAIAGGILPLMIAMPFACAIMLRNMEKEPK